MTIFFDSAPRSVDPYPMKTAIVIGILVGLAGCAGEPAATCDVPPSYVVSYGDCNSKLADGTEAVVFCGKLPPDGAAGTLIPDGCTVRIGTSKPETATCLEECP